MGKPHTATALEVKPLSTDDRDATTRLFTVRDLARRLTISRSTIGRWVQAGDLPAPIQLSAHRIAWRERDIADWLEVKR